MLGTDHEPGIYVRTLNDLFRAIEETSNDMEYDVSMSYLEVSPPPTPAWTSSPGARSLGSFLGCSLLLLSHTHC